MAGSSLVITTRTGISDILSHDNMPSKSPKQARFMAAAAHDPGFAKSAGIPQGVAREFNQADAGSGILQHNKRTTRVKLMKGIK